jgi:hypothetical protein
MIRTLVTPLKNSISFNIPEDYIGKQIEVIAFAKDEGIETEHPLNKKVSFTVLKTDFKGYKFNREEANER